MPAFTPRKQTIPDWAVSGCEGRERRFLTSINLEPPLQEATNLRIARRWQAATANEIRTKGYYLEDARFAVVGFGSAGRVALSAVRAARAEGIPVGLLRPITVAPFPTDQVAELARQVEGMLVVEMNAGQMLDDVRLAVSGKTPVEFYGRLGGVVPLPDEILTEIRNLATQPLTTSGHPRDRWLARMAQRN
jgi:2-oxoglutarate ferredoxin oxidoreductase subunit alpha